MRGGLGRESLQVGLIAVVVFLVLRIGFDIPFWVVAITVVVLSMLGSILLRPTDVAGVPVAHDPGVVDPALAGRVIRDEPFVLSEADLVAGKGVSGFIAISGQGIGGGRFPRVELALGERVVLAVSGGRAGGFLRASLGYITLTDRRLVFTGEKPLLDLLFFLPGRANLLQLSLPYAEIESIRLAKQLNLGMLLASLRPAVVILTRDRQQHFFWPNVFKLLAFIDRIEELKKVG